MKKVFAVFRKADESGQLRDKLNQQEHGATAPQTPGPDEKTKQVPAKLASGEDAPDWYEKNKQTKNEQPAGDQQTEGPE
jgi:hypothetical protein